MLQLNLAAYKLIAESLTRDAYQPCKHEKTSFPVVLPRTLADNQLGHL